MEAHQVIGTRPRDSGGEARRRQHGTRSGVAGSGSREHQCDVGVPEEVAVGQEDDRR
jgi:hypothetical protein